MQSLINRAEGLPPPEPSMLDELAAHLDGKAHPLPHPKRYDHGYIKFSTFKTPDLTKFTKPASSAQHSFTKHSLAYPGPITMQEPSVNWGAIFACALNFTLLAAITYPLWSRWVK